MLIPNWKKRKSKIISSMGRLDAVCFSDACHFVIHVTLIASFAIEKNYYRHKMIHVCKYIVKRRSMRASKREGRKPVRRGHLLLYLMSKRRESEGKK